MLNLLQHYQKYQKQCGPNKIQATAPTQLCNANANLNPKYRQYTNCVQSSPGMKGGPQPPNTAPQRSARDQQKDNDLWIGVM